METGVVNKDTLCHFLYASTIFVSDRGALIQTVLGSCVAVCLWDASLSIGGMNHYMLPYWDGKGLSSPKFGNIAIPKLAEKMIAAGSRKENLVAKVFGGAELLNTGNSIFNIGQRNIEVAWEILEELKIPVASKHVGGASGRKIYFNSGDGSVRMKILNSTNSKVA